MGAADYFSRAPRTTTLQLGSGNRTGEKIGCLQRNKPQVCLGLRSVHCQEVGEKICGVEREGKEDTEVHHF